MIAYLTMKKWGRITVRGFVDEYVDRLCRYDGEEYEMCAMWMRPIRGMRDEQNLHDFMVLK